MAAPAHPCEEPYLPFDPQSYHWADVPPTFQYDGPADVLVGILYDPAYSSAMDLFRTLYPRREFSARALALTTHLATLNASSYSVWSYRADILIDGVDPALGNRAQRLAKELDWMEDMARGNMKSYQVWQHRRLILSALGDPSKELAFVTNVLDKDAKNYHTWAYRQWVLSQYGGLSSASAQRATHPSLWDGELDYIEKLFAEDVRNNSVWNHRFFVVFARGASDIDEEQRRKLVEKEVKWVCLDIPAFNLMSRQAESHRNSPSPPGTASQKQVCLLSLPMRQLGRTYEGFCSKQEMFRSLRTIFPFLCVIS